MESSRYRKRILKTMVTMNNCIVIAVVLLGCIVMAEKDFNENCEPCKCKWNSGKKAADCQNKSIKAVPKHLNSEIQVIDLSSNEIAEIFNEEFVNNNLPNLHKIYMKNCTLQEIHKQGLHGLTILIEFDISNNQVKVLKPGLFDDLHKLRNVILNYNQIERLDDNLFVNLPYLMKIEIKHNRLMHVGQSVFVDIPKPVTLYLEFNNLSVLRKETFQKLNLSSLSLSANPWNCSCDLKPFRDYMIEQKLYTPPTTCETPAALKGKEWTDVSPESFACQPQIIRRTTVDVMIDSMADNVTLICQSKGFPQPNITWSHNQRPVSKFDSRVTIKDSIELNQIEAPEIYTSELIIQSVKPSDKGQYMCVSTNTGGQDVAVITLSIAAIPVMTSGTFIPTEKNDNLMIIACIVAAAILVILLIIILILCCYCRRSRKYVKNGSISENGLVPIKEKSQNDSLLEGSVILEMQKSLLTDVNPVEKPPRHSTSESAYRKGDLRDSNELNRTLLDDPVFGIHDEETQSIALSDTTPRTRTTYVDDGYGTTLPPDLLAFSQRFPQSPSLQSSMSNIQDGRLYVKSPVSSPVYQNNPNVFQGQMIPAGFRTLQHPKTGRTITLAPNRSQSPFTPAPLMYPPVMMKQGYVTIPRKQRIPSWTPSMNSGVSDYPPTSPTSTVSTEIVEPVYDNLGLRTTAAGNSALNINKLGQSKMKDRPLPATPNIRDPKMSYEPIGEVATIPVSMLATGEEPLYGGSGTTPVITATGEMATKAPPRPPPKPNKYQNRMGNNGGGPNSSNQLFEDEGEDGTEV